MNDAIKIPVVNMNPDPITDAPGSHPLGTGIGSASGATVGAMAGAVLGPVGMLVGGTIGAIVGAAAGHGVAEQFDPTGEIEYWRVKHVNRPYVDDQRSFETDYAPAFLYGVHMRMRDPERTWDLFLENELRLGWNSHRGSSKLSWEAALPAVRDAWERSDRPFVSDLEDASDRHFHTGFSAAQSDDAGAVPEHMSVAWRYGINARSMHPGREWNDELEAELARGWPLASGTSQLSFEHARAMIHEAWDRDERPQAIAPLA